MNLLRTVLLISILISLCISQTYVIGFEIHRFYAPSWTFLVSAFLLLVVTDYKKAFSKLDWGVSLSLLFVGTYFTWRSLTSDVSILANQDYPVFFYGLITFLVTSHLAKYRYSLVVILLYFAILFLLQVSYFFTPVTLELILDKIWGASGDKNTYHGFFLHHGPFTCYAAISVALICSLFFLKSKSRIFNLGFKIALVTLYAGAVWATYKSGSRSGAMITALSGMLIFSGGYILQKFTTLKKNYFTFNRVIALAIALGCAGVVSLFGAFKVYQKTSLVRNLSGEVSDDLTKGVRLVTMGMGVGHWMESPLLGNGPRSFGYESPSIRKNSSLKGYMPDILMVHNDYIQTLSEYGIIGLLLILASLLAILIAIWKKSLSIKSSQDSWFIAPLSSTVAIITILLHSLSDFNAHSLAVFAPFCAVLGLAFGYSGSKEPNDKFSIPKMLMSLTLIVVPSLGLYLIGGNQIAHNLELIKYEHSIRNQSANQIYEETKKICTIAPDPFLINKFTRLQFEKINSLGYAPEEKSELLNEALNFLQIALVQHPYHIPNLINSAIINLELKQVDEAEPYLTRAFQLKGRSFGRDHLGPTAEKYLTRKGELLWLNNDLPKAIKYLQEAKKYNRSRALYSGKNTFYKFRRTNKKRIEKNLKYLEKEGVKPIESITFFEGYGLK